MLLYDAADEVIFGSDVEKQPIYEYKNSDCVEDCFGNEFFHLKKINGWKMKPLFKYTGGAFFWINFQKK